MALKHVKQYYIDTLQQYIEAKADLADFEEAVRAGNITEDRLEEVKEELDKIRENVDRLGYVIFLFGLPNRTQKEKRYLANNKEILAKFHKAGCDKGSVILEDDNLMKLITTQLKDLTEKTE